MIRFQEGKMGHFWPERNIKVKKHYQGCLNDPEVIELPFYEEETQIDPIDNLQPGEFDKKIWKALGSNVNSLHY